MRESDHLEYQLGDGWTVTVVGTRRTQRGVIAEAILKNGTIRHYGPLFLSDPSSWAAWLDAAATDNSPSRGALESVFQQHAYPDALDLLQEDPAPNGGQADVIAEMIPQTDLFHHGGRGYATVDIAGRRETFAISSSAFRTYLARRCYIDGHRIPSQETLRAGINALDGIATFDGRERPVYIRTAEHDGNIYLDLADDQGRVVRITSGGREIVTNPPVLFLRPSGMKPLPVPASGGSLADLRRYVNVPKGDGALALSLGWLLGAIRPTGPYPILIITGEDGSAKTTAADFLRSLTDPNMAPVRTLPRKEEDLLIAATRAQVLVFDNLSRLSEELSDALCRLATGGGLSKRQLYTDGDETILDAQRPVILTSIEDVATRSDLLDRAIVLQLPRIAEEDRRPERALRASFEEARPRLLGALLDAMSTALGNLPTTQLDTWPRMADFAQLVVAAETALPVPPRTFLNAYTGNRTEAREVALEAYPIAGPLRTLVEACAGHWQGSATEMLAELEKRADEATRQSRSWPKAPNALSGHLRRLQGSLRAVGIAATRTRDNTGSRWILQKIVTDRHAPKTVGGTPETGDDHGDDVTAGDDVGDGLSTRIVTATPRSDARNAGVTIGDDLLHGTADPRSCPHCQGGLSELPDGGVVCDACERVIRHA